MNPVSPGAPVWTALIPVAVLAFVLFRNARGRRLRIERLWIAPMIVMLAAGLVLANSPPPSPPGLLMDIAALAVGAALGWWRARTAVFTINPETHEITSKVSVVGLLILVGIFALRFALRGLLTADASMLHVSAAEATDSVLLLAVGLVSAQRIEWLIRARRMLAQARGSAA